MTAVPAIDLDAVLRRLADRCPSVAQRVRCSPTGESCWFWVGALASNGYGRCWIGGVSRYAHRVVYELAHQITLDAAQVLAHRCDEASCVNPAHLEVADQARNLADASRKGRLGRHRHGVLDPRRARGRAHAIRGALKDGWDPAALTVALTDGQPTQPTLPLPGVTTPRNCH
jgi:hypothetical protein